MSEHPVEQLSLSFPEFQCCDNQQGTRCWGGGSRLLETKMWKAKMCDLVIGLLILNDKVLVHK